jgi:hypothetical protein
MELKWDKFDDSGVLPTRNGVGGFYCLWFIVYGLWFLDSSTSPTEFDPSWLLIDFEPEVDKGNCRHRTTVGRYKLLFVSKGQIDIVKTFRITRSR